MKLVELDPKALCDALVNAGYDNPKVSYHYCWHTGNKALMLCWCSKADEAGSITVLATVPSSSPLFPALVVPVHVDVLYLRSAGGYLLFELTRQPLDTGGGIE